MATAGILCAICGLYDMRDGDAPIDAFTILQPEVECLPKLHMLACQQCQTNLRQLEAEQLLSVVTPREMRDAICAGRDPMEAAREQGRAFHASARRRGLRSVP